MSKKKLIKAVLMILSVLLTITQSATRQDGNIIHDDLQNNSI